MASGAISESLLRAKALAAAGANYREGWILMAATTVKTFLNIFIGVWAFILAMVWLGISGRRQGAQAGPGEIWERMPKFVLGYFITFFLMLALATSSPALLEKAKFATAESNIFRVLLFVMTFFSFGLLTNFRKLRQEGLARLALAYGVCLFGFVIWVGLIVAYLFFGGLKPPLT